MDENKWINERMIFMCIAGSHAYGLNNAESDVDFRGVCVPPIEYFAGLQQFEQKDKWADGADRVVFNISKFVELAAKANPNILELLFMPDDCIEFTTPLWQSLMNIRHEFLTKRVKHTYSGYAHSQLKRIETHRRWLLKPPDHEPTREEFGLTNKRMSKEVYAMLETFGSTNLDTLLDGEFPELRGTLMSNLEAERKWRSSRKEWESYQQWKRERNPARHELEKKYGYDTKHGSHCIRLMLQGLEILEEGNLSVRLPPDSRELCLAIKNGGYPYANLMALAEGLMNRFESSYEPSPLPHSPNLEVIEEALIETILQGCDLSYVGRGYSFERTKGKTNGAEKTATYLPAA